MLVKIHIDENISIKDLRNLKKDLKKNKIKVYKMYCNLASDLIKLHLSDSISDNNQEFENILKKHPLIKDFREITK